MRIGWVCFCLVLCAAGVVGPVVAEDFPPVTEAESGLEVVPGYPEAPAVLLYRNAHFTMMGALGSEAFSSLEVEGRLKLLTEEGTDFGVIDPSIANPNWFEKVLARVEIGGREVFLDPSEPGAGFGYLLPDLEGMPALVYDTRKPELIEIPARPFEDNLRRAAVELRVDEAGGLRGTGSMVLSGHHAGSWLLAHGTSEGLREGLDEYLGDRFPGFTVSDVTVDEDRDGPRIEITWRLEQVPEEVLGDQATVDPSRPLGPISQRFVLAPVERRSPVLLSFGDRDDLELTVRWPEGWLADVVPEAESFDNAAGAFSTAVDLDEGERTLRFTRRFDTVERSFMGSDAYAALRNLYGRVEAGDRQPLVLVRQ